jgi:hypothetical protein
MCTTADSNAERDLAGLCADCGHAQRILSQRGALFFLCGLSLCDPHFAKYPRLPVLRCPGFLMSPESAGIDGVPV